MPSQTGWGTRSGIGDISAATAAADKLNAEEKNLQRDMDDRSTSGGGRHHPYGTYTKDNAAVERNPSNSKDAEAYRSFTSLLDPNAQTQNPYQSSASSTSNIELGSMTSHHTKSTYLKPPPSSTLTSTPRISLSKLDDLEPLPSPSGLTFSQPGTNASSNPYLAFAREMPPAGPGVSAASRHAGRQASISRRRAERTGG